MKMIKALLLGAAAVMVIGSTMGLAEARRYKSFLSRMYSLRAKYRVRIYDAKNTVIYSGQLFETAMETMLTEPWEIHSQNDLFRVLSFPITSGSTVIGTLQIGENYHKLTDDLKERGFIILLESAIIALLVYFIGWFFANRSLQPALTMQKRLEQFSHDASHELKTPLALANSSLDLAQKERGPSENITMAKAALHRAAALVDKLLQLAKLTKFTMDRKPINLATIVRDSANDFKEKAMQEKVTLVVDTPENVTVDADPIYARLLIDNLLANAIKFSHEKGVVEIHLTEHTLEVRDRGIGIPKEKQSRLFDPFFQADASHATEGSGLGLSIAKKIVEAHEWGIAVESIQNVGTAFMVRLK